LTRAGFGHDLPAVGIADQTEGLVGGSTVPRATAPWPTGERGKALWNTSTAWPLDAPVAGTSPQSGFSGAIF